MLMGMHNGTATVEESWAASHKTKYTLDIRGLSGKSPATVNIMRVVCNLAAEESGLECMCVNNDDITVLVSGGSRCH